MSIPSITREPPSQSLCFNSKSLILYNSYYRDTALPYRSVPGTSTVLYLRQVTRGHFCFPRENLVSLMRFKVQLSYSSLFSYSNTVFILSRLCSKLATLLSHLCSKEEAIPQSFVFQETYYSQSLVFQESHPSPPLVCKNSDPAQSMIPLLILFCKRAVLLTNLCCKILSAHCVLADPPPPPVICTSRE
jgi:hypothetical protein